MASVKKYMAEFMRQGRDPLSGSTIRINADVLAVQHNGVVSQQVTAIPDIFDLYGTP